MGYKLMRRSKLIEKVKDEMINMVEYFKEKGALLGFCVPPMPFDSLAEKAVLGRFGKMSIIFTNTADYNAFMLLDVDPCIWGFFNDLNLLSDKSKEMVTIRRLSKGFCG